MLNTATNFRTFLEWTSGGYALEQAKFEGPLNSLASDWQAIPSRCIGSSSCSDTDSIVVFSLGFVGGFDILLHSQPNGQLSASVVSR